MPSIAIVGVGRLGGALALALSRGLYEVKELVHRGKVSALKIRELIPGARLSAITDDASLESDIILLTTPDPEITQAVAALRGQIRPDAIVMHTSGSLASDILAGLPNAAASLHPLVSISDPLSGSEKFAGAYFCVEGAGRAEAAAKAIVTALGGQPFSIDTKLKPLYHASAVMASGHFTALEDMAIEMLSRCGLPSGDAKKILLPLVRSTLENLEAQPNQKALTGTFARVDVETFERHLASFRNHIPIDIQHAYLLLATRSLDLAEKAGASSEKIEDLRDRLSSALSAL